MHSRPLLLIALSVAVASASQLPLSAGGTHEDEYYQFSHPVQRVAVIGAGACGLQAAASLIENGFQVRLFERQDQPGGNWYYRDQTPIHASFP